MKLLKKKDTGVHPKKIMGAPTFCDAEKDLYSHRGVPGDSCFIVANVMGDDGNRYNFLIHSGALVPEDQPEKGMICSMVSLTDCAGKEYLHAEKIFPMEQCIFALDHFELTSPVSSMKGNSTLFTVYGLLPDGRGEIQGEMVNDGPTLNNCSVGKFSCMNQLVEFHHYGLPYLKTKGKIVLDGRSIAFHGDAWLDRQWGSGELPLPIIMAQNKIQTKWMDLNLSNEYKISLWDILADNGIENAWATVLSPEGVHTIAPMTPLVHYEEDYWYSEFTGNYYPTKYIVELPAIDTRIHVQVYSDIPQQEAVSVSGYHRYEAHCDCKGIFQGEEVTGFCCVELVGDFGQQCKDGWDSENIGEPLTCDVNGTYYGVMHSPMGDKKIVFDYRTEGTTLTGTIELLGKKSVVEDGNITGNHFTHHFKMKLPLGKKCVDAMVSGWVEGNQLHCNLKTPMGILEIDGEK